MDRRPQGNVTFLFTDIEQSTRLWELYPVAMWNAFTQQEQIIRQVCSLHTGFVYKMVGDAFQVAFATAEQALLAAVEIQRSLIAAAWGETDQLHIRMALHSGTTQERNDDYVGPLLNRLARLLETGYGDQILLSQETVQSLQAGLPPGMELCDLGQHYLRDLVRPVRIFQVLAPGLPSAFSPLKSANPHQTARALGPASSAWPASSARPYHALQPAHTSFTGLPVNGSGTGANGVHGNVAGSTNDWSSPLIQRWVNGRHGVRSAPESSVHLTSAA
jgi:class 3 adenylate cyclase